MKDLLISILRNKHSTAAEYRQVTERLGFLLAVEIAEALPKDKMPIETPLEATEGHRLSHPIVLVPILRAGLSLLYPFMRYYPDAKVGFIGIRRDEVTAEPHVYYSNLPPIMSSERVIVLEPMIATGGSSIQAISMLCSQGAKEENILFVSIIASPQGVQRIQKRFPKVNLHVAQVDRGLDSHHFIVPGLGDFGDRYFGT